jgi:hypothetical protein
MITVTGYGEDGGALPAALGRERGGAERVMMNMAKRIENECAFYAEEVVSEERVVGNDWKVYCSRRCAEAGETMSSEQWRQLMRLVTSRNGFFAAEQIA